MSKSHLKLLWRTCENLSFADQERVCVRMRVQGNKGMDHLLHNQVLLSTKAKQIPHLVVHHQPEISCSWPEVPQPEKKEIVR